MERDSSLRVPTAIRLLPPIAGFFALAVGLVVAAGWVFDSGALAGLGLPGLSMKLSTAAGIASAGGATLLITFDRGRRPAIALCGVVLLLTLGALVDWAFSVSLGIARLFPANPGRPVVSGHTAPHTAVVLALFAGALLTLDARHLRAHRVLVSCTLAGTFLSAIGYLYGASTTHGVSSFTGMSLPSLIAMTVLSCGLVVLGVDRGLKLTLVHRGTAGQLTRRLLPAAVLVPVLLGALALAGEHAGFYDASNGFALFAWAMMAVFSLLVLSFTLALRGREDAQAAAESAMSKARADIDRFFAVSLELMLIANADTGFFVRVNPAFEVTLGWSIEELEGRPFMEFVHPDDAAATAATSSAQRGGQVISSFENRYRCKDGSYRWLLWSATANDKNGLIYATARDVTERKKMEERLHASEESALEASRLKSEFVASMSHELRTPLNGVIGMTDLLRYTSLDDAQTGYVKALGVSSEALLAVINDVLDFSKIEAGHLQLDPTDFDLRGVVEEATLMLAGQAHAKGLEIGHWVEANVPVTVHADRARVRQVLLNLLSNAVKFTAIGDVTVRVTSRPGEELHLAVLDTGIGIDEAQGTALFEAFAQADQSTTRQYGGTGLGLAISRRLVELMGGAIGAAPRVGGGSMFWFSAVMPAVTGPALEAPSRPDLEARRILVVDDNQTNRTIIESYLRSWGVASESVDRPSGAIVELERAAGQGQPFELALIDVNLPQMDGIELVGEIRKRPALGTLRVVLLSSTAFERDRLDSIGVSATLTKPTRQSELYEAITDALAGRRFPEAPTPAPGPAAKPLAVRPGQLVLIAEDNEINYALAEALFSAMGLQTAVARNGREAVAMALAGEYALIFMDCQMPEVDGFEAARQIRAAEPARRIPIVAMTALSMPGDRQRCVAAGMDDYLSKPIRREELEAVVERWLPGSEASSLPEDRHQDAGAAEDAQTPGAVLDLAAVGRVRGALTPAKYALLLDRFDAQQRICVAEIGIAVERGDRTEVRRVAHKLKGSSASLGASRLQMCCLALEHLEPGDALGEPQMAALRGSAAEASDALRHELTH